jgi:Ca2+-binding EF-hand superfamily protein
VITHPELDQLLKNIGVNLSTDEFKEVLKKVDKDDTGTVEFDNFFEVGFELV